MPTVEPSAERLQQFATEKSDDSAIVMINLLRYRDRAQYPPGAAAHPCSGREAYRRYAAAVTPMITDVGGKVLWSGSVQRTLIGPEDEAWDDAILVEYPSRRAFLAMISQANYLEAAEHRTAALADSRLIASVSPAGLL